MPLAVRGQDFGYDGVMGESNGNSKSADIVFFLFGRRRRRVASSCCALSCELRAATQAFSTRRLVSHITLSPHTHAHTEMLIYNLLALARARV